VTRVTGSGWIGARGFGSGQRTDTVWPARQRLAEHVASPPAGKASRNYGRFDLPTRLVCHAVHLALQDAGFAADRPCPDGSGLIGTGDVGTLAANLAYYRDFCDHGKVLGRSNLFIYTLPTSALAEAAIHFRLNGPLLFLASGPDGDLSPAFRAAGDFLAGGAVPCMLVCDAAPTAAIVHVVEGGRGSDGDSIGAVLAAADALRRIAAGQDGSRA
jgi:hypothetical protein